jgi:hypothetical protein
VQVNFKFGLGVAGEKGEDSIERGYDLEQQVPLRSVAPLCLFAPLVLRGAACSIVVRGCSTMRASSSR